MADFVTETEYNRTVTAFFDTREQADKAVHDLTMAGIARDQITIAGEGGTTAASTDTKGFWESLKDFFLPDEDRSAYAEGLRRGGYLVSARTTDKNYDRIIDILDRDGSVNMDEREAQWRSEGWTGMTNRTSTAGDLSMAASGATALSANDTIRGRTVETTSTEARNISTSMEDVSAIDATRRTGATSTLAAGQDEVIPVYEENLQVGKRDVSHGRVRLRSYVVETPVNEQVRLHSESVYIDRKPVDRPINPGDALFQDRVIEAEERAEEAIVAKEARVKEEITLRKQEQDRVENVNDTVRRTEVEIDDARDTRGGTSMHRFADAIDRSQIVEHMDVIASDGTKVGVVDHMEGTDRIKLTKSASPDGQHHFIPLEWVDRVDTHVHLRTSSAETQASW